jgi:hypothetical protein
MAIRKKKRRKITVNKRPFTWWVSEDQDSPDIVLRIFSEDKKFIVSYQLNQPDTQRFLIVLGKEFPGLSNAGSGWIRVKCPKWETDSTITPAIVRHVIKWCLFTERPLVQVNWKGEVIETKSQISSEAITE